MNIKAAFSILLCILASFTYAFPQENKAEKIDEFQKITCDHLHALVTSYAQTADNDPEARIYILINAPKGNIFRAISYEILILGVLSQIAKSDKPQEIFEKTRVSIIRAGEADQIEAQVWKVYQDAKLPFSGPAGWNFKIDGLEKRRFFTNNAIHDDGVCPVFDNIHFLPDILNSNPDIILKIGIFSKFKRKLIQERQKLEKKLFDDLKLEKNRVKIILSNKPKELSRSDVFFEIWLMPPKKP